ncbi:MAG: 5-formyltetrahydrofolate cyclo-ligase [Halieaceae bacterium]
MSKADLRRQLRATRRELSNADREAHARAVATHLIGTSDWRDAGNIAVYIASDGELDTKPVVHAARAQGKSVFLPVIRPDSSLHFREWRPDAALTDNRYGIPEPPDSADSCASQHLDLVCLPLVAWDRTGTRLGMGGGFYDRTFAGNENKRLLVGLAYGLQEQAKLPRDNWDVSLDMVITESGLINCSS